jgi:hypothetical protein
MSIDLIMKVMGQLGTEIPGSPFGTLVLEFLGHYGETGSIWQSQFSSSETVTLENYHDGSADIFSSGDEINSGSVDITARKITGLGLAWDVGTLTMTHSRYITGVWTTIASQGFSFNTGDLCVFSHTFGTVLDGDKFVVEYQEG